MALHVSYKNRMGYCYLKSMDGTKTWKIWFCHANALCAMMYFYRKQEDGKLHDMVQLNNFLLDVQHAKRCIQGGAFKDYYGFTFFANELTPNMWKLVKIMAKSGIKVIIK